MTKDFHLFVGLIVLFGLFLYVLRMDRFAEKAKSSAILSFFASHSRIVGFVVFFLYLMYEFFGFAIPKSMLLTLVIAFISTLVNIIIVGDLQRSAKTVNPYGSNAVFNGFDVRFGFCLYFGIDMAMMFFKTNKGKILLLRVWSGGLVVAIAVMVVLTSLRVLG